MGRHIYNIYFDIGLQLPSIQEYNESTAVHNPRRSIRHYIHDIVSLFYILPGQCFVYCSHTVMLESSLRLRNDVIRANPATLMTTHIECVHV